MATTLKKISEQVLRVYNRGNPSDNEIDRREIDLIVQQVLNRVLKTEYLNINIPMQEHVPPHALIAEYTAPVSQYIAGVKSFDCTSKVADFLFYQSWQTPLADDWIDPSEDAWILPYQDVDVTITIVSSSDTKIYKITVAGYTRPSDVDQGDIKSFIENCTGEKVLKFEETDESTTPHKFYVGGISTVTEGAAEFSFIYDLSQVSSADSAIQDEVQATHDILESKSSTTIVQTKLGNVSCCLLTTSGGNSKGKITLPAQPIQLPRHLGVWRIYNPTAPHSPYIPMQAGMQALVGGSSHNDLDTVMGGLTAFEVINRDTVIFNQDASDLPSTVGVQLLIVDPNELDETDILPIPTDMEDTVIRECLNILGIVAPADISE